MLSKAEAAFVVNHQVGKQSLPHVALESHTPAFSQSLEFRRPHLSELGSLRVSQLGQGSDHLRSSFHVAVEVLDSTGRHASGT